MRGREGGSGQSRSPSAARSHSIQRGSCAAKAMHSHGLALLLLLLLGVLHSPEGKPISLTYRCPCRYFESNVAKSHVKHLKILTVPGCSLQIIARLKNSSKQICVDPKLKWLHEYLEKYLHKRVKM